MYSGLENLRVEDNYFPQHASLNVGGKLYTFDRPQVVGILNCTPDSFFAGSRSEALSDVLMRAEQLVREGADVLDVGGYSTRPGAVDISVDEELQRVIPAIEAISNRFPELLISIDTFRAEVAKAAIQAGAHIVNDVSGGTLDDRLFDTVAELKCPYILTHIKGSPQTMQQETVYTNLFKDIAWYFSEKIDILRSKGVSDIIIDPGFGFAKTTEQNYELFARLSDFGFLGYPIMVGISRKSMIWKELNTDADHALNGTTALHMAACMKGASFLRAHDVKEAVETVRLYEKLHGKDYPDTTFSAG